jgi:iron complex outermembrane receptor protein
MQKRCLVLFVLTVAPRAALAGEVPRVTLPVVTVTAEEESLTSLGVESAKENIRRIPGGAAIVPSEEFREGRAATVKDMLDYVPGVFAQSRVNEESRLSIRGSGLSRTFHLRGIALLQDGVPINLADGSADFQDIDPLAFRYVEVHKGANALRYGAASLGGAIDFVTPTGYDADAFRFRIDGGGSSALREQFSSGQAVGDTDYFVSATNRRSQGFRGHSEQDNTRFNANIGQKLSDAVETRFYFAYGDINQELPGSLTKAQLEADPRQANPTNRSMNQQRDFRVLRLANKTSWRGENVRADAGVYTTQKDLYHPIFQLIDQQTEDYGAFGDGALGGTLAGHKNEIAFGVRLGTGETEERRYVNQAGGYGALTNEGIQKSRNGALYAENRFYARDDLALIAGAQFTYARRELDDRFLADGDRSGSKSYAGISPKIGALWEPSPGVQFFTNLSRAYEPPTFSELTQSVPGASGLADIDAQTSTTFEIGARGEYGAWNWDASAYRARLKDELFAYSLGGSATAVLNADDTVHQGIELGLRAKLCDAVAARLAYAYSDFRFDGDVQWGDARIPGAPEHYLRAELRYESPSGFYLAPNVEAVPEPYPVDMANTLHTDSYALLGLQAGYKLNKHAALFLDLRNLTDETYAATTGVITRPTATNGAQFVPGDGRGAYAGVTYAW